MSLSRAEGKEAEEAEESVSMKSMKTPKTWLLVLLLGCFAVAGKSAAPTAGADPAVKKV